jgi:3-dehydroquinate dehydratase-2
MKINGWIINGVNLNLLGHREREWYGSKTLEDIEQNCLHQAKKMGIALQCVQSNHEGQIVEWIHQAFFEADFVIINPGAYSHTSIAIYDALSIITVPVIEVHLTNIYKREPFRHHSYVSPKAYGIICGFGPMSYTMALEAAYHLCCKEESPCEEAI